MFMLVMFDNGDDVIGSRLVLKNLKKSNKIYVYNDIVDVDRK